MLGPLPIPAQPLEGPAHALDRDRRRDHALLEADLGGRVQGPERLLVAKLARGLVQQLGQPRGVLVREGGAQPMGPRRAFLQHRQTLGIEPVDHIAHGLAVAAQLPANGRCAFAAGTGQQNLAAAQDKGIRRAQARLEVSAFVVVERADKHGCFHALHDTTSSTAFRE